MDFESPIPRQNTHAMKWARYENQNILPFWVADMDFAAPECVIAALQKRMKHPVLGYTEPDSALNQTFADYASRHYDWEISPEWLVWIPGLVPALNVTARLASGNVIVTPPVYPPFLKAPIFNAKTRVDVPLIAPNTAPAENQNAWQMDFAALENAFKNAAPDSVFFLCHPHNPVGRAWEAAELQKIAALAAHYQITVCSDEIHCDLILDATRHTPFLKIAENPAITLMAPSKTYNLPGLCASLAIIPDKKLRARFLAAKAGLVTDINVFGFEGARAAFSGAAEPWRQELLKTLRRNRDEVFTRVNALPNIQTHWVQATYLAWIKVADLKLKNPAQYFESQGIALSNGADFGDPNFLRLNFGTTPTELAEGLNRFEKAIQNL